MSRRFLRGLQFCRQSDFGGPEVFGSRAGEPLVELPLEPFVLLRREVVPPVPDLALADESGRALGPGATPLVRGLGLHGLEAARRHQLAHVGLTPVRRKAAPETTTRMQRWCDETFSQTSFFFLGKKQNKVKEKSVNGGAIFATSSCSIGFYTSIP